MPDDDAALQKNAADLIDHGGPLADQARPDPVQRLQIQLFVGFGWNKACRRPLYRLSYGLGISEMILVPLPKRRAEPIHVVAKCGKLARTCVTLCQSNGRLGAAAYGCLGPQVRLADFPLGISLLDGRGKKRLAAEREAAVKFVDREGSRASDSRVIMATTEEAE